LRGSLAEKLNLELGLCIYKSRDSFVKGTLSPADMRVEAAVQEVEEVGLAQLPDS